MTDIPAGIVEVLIQARDRIGDSKYWCQGAFTRALRPTTEKAYCAVGALRVCEEGVFIEYYARAFLRQAAFLLFDNSIVRVNDQLGHQAVMDAYDEAIRLAKEYDNYMSGELT